MKYKGKGEHSVNELESIIEFQQEELHKKQIANQDLLKAVESTSAFFDDMPKGQFGKIVFNIGLMNEMFVNIAEATKTN